MNFILRYVIAWFVALLAILFLSFLWIGVALIIAKAFKKDYSTAEPYALGLIGLTSIIALLISLAYYGCMQTKPKAELSYHGEPIGQTDKYR